MCSERGMSSREKNQTTPHQPLLSSLVIRPAESSGGGGGGGGGGTGSDYEPGEVRRDPPPYSRSDRYESHGYRMRAGSVSPLRRRDANHHRFSPGFEPSIGTSSRSRGFGSGREPGRFRDHSPPFGRGKFSDRGHHHSSRGPVSFRDEGLPRNNPNVQPREGDWICSDPSCKNLNFARRDQCNNCNRPRYASSSGRGYLGPTFPPRQRAAPLDHSPPRRITNGGYNRSPPRGWPRDAPPHRDLRPPIRFPDPLIRSDRQQEYSEDNNRYRFDRPLVPDWGGPHRDRGRDSSNYLNERRGFGRRALSPPPAPPVPPPRGGGGWGSSHIIRDRSRSPARGGALPPRDYHHRDLHMNNRRRDDHRGGGGGRGGRDPF
ncbi:hypothetical protein ACP275_11G049400 [Erythranthe tilingii]